MTEFKNVKVDGVNVRVPSELLRRAKIKAALMSNLAVSAIATATFMIVNPHVTPYQIEHNATNIIGKVVLVMGIPMVASYMRLRNLYLKEMLRKESGKEEK
jgi:post-segregation antitoxin (ccd killing protein)